MGRYLNNPDRKARGLRQRYDAFTRTEQFRALTSHPQDHDILVQTGMRVLDSGIHYGKALLDNAAHVLEHHPERYAGFLDLGCKLSERKDYHETLSFFKEAPGLMDYPDEYTLYLSTTDYLIYNSSNHSRESRAYQPFVKHAPGIIRSHPDRFEHYTRTGFTLFGLSESMAASFFNFAPRTMDSLQAYQQYSETAIELAMNNTNLGHTFVTNAWPIVGRPEYPEYARISIERSEKDDKLATTYIVHGAWLLQWHPSLYRQFTRVGLALNTHDRDESRTFFNSSIGMFKKWPEYVLYPLLDCMQAVLDRGKDAYPFIQKAPELLNQIRSWRRAEALEITALAAQNGSDPEKFLDRVANIDTTLDPKQYRKILKTARQLAHKNGDVASDFLIKGSEILLSSQKKLDHDNLLLEYLYDMRTAGVISQIIDLHKHGKEYAEKVKKFY